MVAWLAAPALQAQTPEWIWHNNHGASPGDNEARVFRKSFTAPGAVAKARLTAAGDNHIVVWLNGQQVAASDDWEKPVTKTVTRAVQPGENLLAAYGRNDSGAAGILIKLELTFADGTKQTVVSDTSWLSSDKEAPGWQKPGFATTSWTRPVSLGKLGVAPWGDVIAGGAGGARATPAESLKVLDGFKVELLRSAEPSEGSWICMAIDPKGRLIISPQGREPMLRLTLSPEGRVAKIEPIDLPARAAMGLLYAFDSLYVNGRGKDGVALYRLRDTNGDDQYDTVETLFKWTSDGGEHGSHGVVLGPDQKLYIVNGNFVNVPPNISPASPHRNYADDLILGRMEDGNGFGAGKKPPGGFILRLDPDGKNPELFAAGQRNDYDIAFSPDGELFGFDSDMEWDWGLPWYRPIRINHLVSGGDYGFREGSGKWPNGYPDSLPTTLDVGLGSPTGVKFGTDSHFPEKYKRAFFAMDWAYGRIFAVHLTPKGATYSATAEVFLQGRPLNLTDFEFGKDGAMYFITGGRGTQSGLYRVSYVGPASRLPSDDFTPVVADHQAAEARALRHQLEAFHGRRDPAAIGFAWPHLNSDDRWIRYAARIAIESQPVEEWQTRALEEERVNASLTALLALARCGDRALQKDLLQSLGRLPADQLAEDQVLAALRVCEVCFTRLGRPDRETSDAVIERLDPLYPAKSEPLNRELCQLLVYLEAPDVVTKTLALLDQAPTQEEQIFYVFTLRKLKTGWTPAQRRHYFSWFNRSRTGLPHTPRLAEWFRDTGQEYHDGASFPKYFAHIESDAVASLSDAERAELKSIIEHQAIAPKPPSVPRKFVKEWKMEDLLPALDEVSHGRSVERGKAVFNDAQCIACHRFGDEGGSVGPDLTAVGSRFTVRDILDSILEPSKVVSEQYQNTTIFKKDGDDVTGRVVEEDDQKVVVVTDPLTNQTTEVRKADIQRRVASKVSPMPEGLVNLLTKDEILDLLAYLESGGNASNTAFAK